MGREDWYATGWCVYQITEVATGKTYVGMSNNGLLRWCWHCRSAFMESSQLPLHTAMRERGIDGFEFRILETCLSKAAAEEAELWHIAQLVNADTPVFNQKGVTRVPQKGDRFGRGNPFIRARVTSRSIVDADMLVRMQGLKALGCSLQDIAGIVGLGKSTVHLYVGNTPRRR